MIKLVDILKEVSPNYNVGEIGWNWPFADEEEIADGWENSRLKTLFKGSLKDWEAYVDHKMGTILHNHHIDQNDTELAGVPQKHGEIENGGYEFVKNLYDKNEVDIYIDASPHPDPEKKY
jgi:hypothetical protein